MAPSWTYNQVERDILTHRSRKLWGGLTAYATSSSSDPNVWTGFFIDAGCYASISWGKQVALQFRVPTYPTSYQWDEERVYGQRYASIRIEDRPRYIEASNAYLDFIMDRKVSPWRFVNHVFEIIRDETGNATGALARGCDVNRQLFHNLCIAFRRPWEEPQLVLRWYELKQHGLDPVASLYYALFFSPIVDKDGNKRITFGKFNSHSFVTSHAGKTAIPALLNFDNVPMGRLHPVLFTSQTGINMSSNYIWMYHGRPAALAVGREFPAALVSSSDKNVLPSTRGITEEDFKANVIEAAARRRKMELGQYNKENI